MLDIMTENVELVLAKTEKLESLQAKSGELSAQAAAFNKGSKKLRRWALMNKVKYGVIAGTALTAAVAVPIAVVVAL